MFYMHIILLYTRFSGNAASRYYSVLEKHVKFSHRTAGFRNQRLQLFQLDFKWIWYNTLCIYEHD